MLQVDHFRIVNTNGSLQSLGTDDLVDQVHGLRWQLDAVDREARVQIRVDVLHCVGVLVAIVNG